MEAAGGPGLPGLLAERRAAEPGQQRGRPRPAARRRRPASPSKPAIIRQPPALVAADLVGLGEVDRGLVLVRQPEHGRQQRRPARACAARRRPSANESNRQPSYTFTAGTGRTRTVTEVITPNAPSEPSTSSRRSGPAALAGALPSSSVPSGVATVRPTTSASKRP